jgi:N5-(carboxyethyl)ornithine synthase
MKVMGFLKSTRRDEHRIAILPGDLVKVNSCEQLVFEKGYGEKLGILDAEYLKHGCQTLDRAEVASQDVVCLPKPTHEDVLPLRKALLFGWIHAVQDQTMAQILCKNEMSAIAWEDMHLQGRHCFWRNNELSGEAAVYHALIQWGRVATGQSVALIGRGNAARGALRVLERLGCDVTVYNRATSHLLREEIARYDIIVNAVLWDTTRTDHLIYTEDLKKMRPGGLIIDVSCDAHMGIESSRPTSVQEPIFFVHGITHYAVDHTPTLCYKTASEAVRKVTSSYIDIILSGSPNSVIDDATIIRDGEILDSRISEFKNSQQG